MNDLWAKQKLEMKKAYLFLLFFIISCSKNENSNDIKFKEIKFETTDLSLKDSIDFKFIPLETNEECLIGIAEDIQMVDDRILILEGKSSENLYVFDLDGKFIANVGQKGNGPGQYSRIFSFDIDQESRSIIISDRYLEKLLFYDLDSYQFKYSRNTKFYYNAFLHLPHGDQIFLGYKGFKNPTDRKDLNSYYVYVTDSLLNPTKSFYKADFQTSYSLTGGKSNLYSYNGDTYIYHHLFPYIYKLEDNNMNPTYKIELEGYVFPTIDFLKQCSGDDKDYAASLIKSEYVTNYRIDECTSMICLSFQKNNQLFYGLYNKKSEKGYLFDLPKYFSTMGLGVLVRPRSATDEYLIAQINIEENSHKYIKHNSQLMKITANRSMDENPIICLYKWKN